MSGSNQPILHTPRAHQQPIIIVGVGRSGSTVLHDILACHPGLAWLSNVTNHFPRRLWLSRWLLQLHRLPLAGRILQPYLKPDEAYDFWEHYSKGFRAPCRDLTAEDLTCRAREDLRHAFAQLIPSSSQRLLLKVTGWPRIGFFNELFPGARFIHVMRDGRAVANSLLQVEFWRGWRGPQGWRYGPLPPDLRQLWEQHDHSFVALAAIQWILQMRAMAAARQQIPVNSLLELRYEGLCQHGPETIARIFRFAGIPPNPKFERSLSRFHLRTQNDKWRSELTERQQAVLQSVLVGELARYGYAEAEQGARAA